MANRRPSTAAQRAGGYGYILVGVEPGTVQGVLPVDFEKLVGQVKAHVSDGVRWSPEYVPVDGVQVLVVIVDPPHPGDRIHHLRKQLDNHQAGTIFVRHAGRTDPATPADLEMLEGRLLDRTPSLQMTATPIPASIEATPDILTATQQWVDQRRPGLLAARHQSTQRTPGISDFMYASAVNSLGALGPTIKPDKRTEEQYVAQVDEYLDEAKDALTQRALWDLYRHTPAQLHVVVTNPTDLGYTKVRLVVHIPGAVHRFPDEWSDMAEGKRVRLPVRPTPLGTPVTQDMGWLAHLANGSLGVVPPIATPASYFTKAVGPTTGPAFNVRDSGSVDIEYREFDLRPGETLTFDQVPLLVQAEPDTTVSASWYATAEGVRGRLTGDFDLAIASSTLDLLNLDRDDAES